MEPFGIEDAVCLKETNEALLIESSFFDEPEWIPKKGVHEDSDIQEKGDGGMLVVEGWLAKSRGWSED